MQKTIFMAGMVVFLALADASFAGTKVPAGEYKITFYCSGPCCCGKWADGYFANGEKVDSCATPTIACNWLKFGSRVRIGDTVYTVRDRGAKSIFGTFDAPKKAFDIYCSSHSEAKNKGVIYTNNVEVLK